MNNREIKFRAWDSTHSEYICWELILEDGFEQYYSDPDITLEQFTGLYDKDGTEIYEGDSLSIVDPDSEVETFRGGEVVFCDEYLGGWKLSSREGKKHLSLNRREKCFKVIGNIHENPELAYGWFKYDKDKQ